MTSVGRFVRGTAVVFVVCGLATVAAADIEVDIPNNIQVVGELEPADEVETYAVFLPAGASLSASTKGLKTKGQDTPAVTFRVLDEGDNQIIAATAKGSGAKLKKFIAPTTGVYRLELIGNGTAGRYSFKAKWKSAKKKGDAGAIPAAGEREIVFSADRGAVVSFQTKRAKRAATLPRLVRVEDSNGNVVHDFAANPSPTATSHKFKSIIADQTGDFTLVINDVTGAGGEATTSVSVKAPKLRKSKLELTDAALGLSNFRAEDGLQAAVLGPQGGEFIADSPDVGDVIGTGLNVPQGALPSPTAVVIGEGRDITPPDGDFDGRSNSVFFGPDGLSFSQPAEVSVPVNLSGLGGDTGSIVVVQKESDGTTSVLDSSTYTFDDEGNVKFPVSHFTTFQVFGAPPDAVETKMVGSQNFSDDFGLSVDVDGDLAVVGAPGELVNSGAIYMYERNGELWEFRQRLVGSTVINGDRFGQAVAISGSTIAATTQTGVFTFEYDGSTWAEDQAFGPDDGTGANETFGQGVAVHGDTVVAGALLHDGGSLDAGAVFVFTRTGGNWSQSQIIVAPNLASGDLFGTAFEVENDTLVVSAPGADQFAINGGSIYAFERANATSDFVQSDAFVMDEVAVGTDFGRRNTLGLSGDRVAVGWYGDATQAGAVFVFDRSGTTWTQSQKLTALDNDVGDLFGSSVDIDGEGIVIAARNDDENASNAGAAYEFALVNTAFIQVRKFGATDGIGDDQIGIDVAISGRGSLVGSNVRAGGAGYFFQLPPVPQPE